MPLQAWEALDPPCGWDTSGPLLATGYYHVTPTALQLVMLMDDALSQACEQGACAGGGNARRVLSWVPVGAARPAATAARPPNANPALPCPCLHRPCAGDTSMAQAVIGAVSKMALMFATMLPPPAASEAPLLALLRFNDLQYIASHLLLLPFLFDPDLKPLLGAGLWFGNEALQLRTAARAAYNDLVRPRPCSAAACCGRHGCPPACIKPDQCCLTEVGEALAGLQCARRTCLPKLPWTATPAAVRASLGHHGGAAAAAAGLGSAVCRCRRAQGPGG